MNKEGYTASFVLILSFLKVCRVVVVTACVGKDV